MGRDAPRFPVTEEVLDNGLRVVIQEDHSTPLVAVHVTYCVGSRDEALGQRGFAHLFEHLFFLGSAHVARGEHFRLVQETGGAVNATTHQDCTTYFQTLPAHELDLALWLEADRMGFLVPALTRENVENQRDVIRNERLQNCDNQPYGRAMEWLLAAAFGPEHPYGRLPLAPPEDLATAAVDDVRAFCERHYAPESALLVICGDVHTEDALSRVHSWFAEIPSRAMPQRPAIPPSERRDAFATMVDRVSLPRVYVLYDAPSFPQTDYEAADVLSALLGQGRGARLVRQLTQRERVAADVACFTWPTERVGMLFVIATAMPGIAADALVRSLDRAIDEVMRDGLLPDEIEGSLNRSRLGLVGQLNSISRRADALSHAVMLKGNPRYLDEVFDCYARVGRDDLERVASQVLGRGRRATLVVLPEQTHA
jgi:zinc protease